ncbi:MAG: hypothetical protein RH946_03415 [Rhodospirillales bacterium]
MCFNNLRGSIFHCVVTFSLIACAASGAHSQDSSKLIQGAAETGKVFGRVYTNTGVLSAVSDICAKYPIPDASFFQSYKAHLLEKYASVAGVLVGVHQELMQERLGQQLEESLSAIGRQIRLYAYEEIKTKLLATPIEERGAVCGNFKNQIENGDWDVFSLADSYFTSLRSYVPSFYEDTKSARDLIERFRTH